MNVRRFMLAAGMMGVALGGTLFTGVASASADTQPCGAAWTHPAYGQVQTCPDWSPASAIPVYAHTGVDADVVGTIDPAGADWYICQLPGRPYGTVNGIANDWWAVTVADNGAHGVVPEVFFRGGGNFQPDAGLRNCM